MAKKEEKPLVGVVMGSDSDLPEVEAAFSELEKFGISYESRVISAHRTPDDAEAYAKSAEKRGLKVLIVAAGWAAHLAGVLAANTNLPVIGIPIASSALSGVDALYSTVQMPPGVPVATMAIGKGGAKNAAIFSVQILALGGRGLSSKLKRAKKEMADQVRKKDEKLQEKINQRKKGA